MGSCVLRETIRKGRPRFAPRVSLSIYLSGGVGRRRVSKADSQAFSGKRLPHRWLGSWRTKPVEATIMIFSSGLMGSDLLE